MRFGEAPLHSQFDLFRIKLSNIKSLHNSHLFFWDLDGSLGLDVFSTSARYTFSEEHNMILSSGLQKVFRAKGSSKLFFTFLKY
jgi:hypothetical protein